MNGESDTAEYSRRPVYSLHAYPWRSPATTRTSHEVSGRRQSRFTLLCPWTGAQGVHTVDARTRLEDIWARYRDGTPGWSLQAYQPVWPGPRHDRITIVPQPPHGNTVCVVVKRGLEPRALVLPARLSHSDLCRAVGFQTRWTDDEVHMPVSLAITRAAQPREAVVLRTGDTLDVIPPAERGISIPMEDQALIRDYLSWTQSIRFLRTVLVRLWSPAWRQPIVTWIAPDTCWLPGAFTFSGEFADNYPGRWTPITWSPSRILQLMCASDSGLRVHVLSEHSEGTWAIALATPISLREIAQELHTEPAALSIVGMPVSGFDTPCHLRNGDVIFDSHRQSASQPIYGWPDDDNGHSTYVLPLSLAWGIGRHRAGLALVLAALVILPVDAVRTAPASPSRSRSPRPKTDGADSPRLGCWRPDQDKPLQDVLTTSKLHYQILCPVQGWSHQAYCFQDTQASHLSQQMQQWCPTWSPGYVLHSGPTETEVCMMIPSGLHRICSVVVCYPGFIAAHFLPRVITYRKLYVYLRKTASFSEARIRMPPALRLHEQFPDEDMHLRDGDSFELYGDPSHSNYRPGQDPPCTPVSRLPHFHAWHLPFRVKDGGWVHVWSPTDDHQYRCARHWISQGDVWSPQWRQFHKPQSLPSADRWVPTAWVADDQCHFVRQSTFGSARVLKVRPSDRRIECCELSLHRADESGVPAGWRLRSDIQASSPRPRVRDGDIIEPTTHASRRRVHLYSRHLLALGSACAGTGSVWRWMIVAMLYTQLASGMVQLPSNTEQVRVGKFAWRVPENMRMCDATVQPGHSAILLSPFTGCSLPIDVEPDTSFEDVRNYLLGSEPAWTRQIAPIWPALSRGHLVFVPVSPSRELVCLIVVSHEWQAAHILPRRTDLEWLLSVLRRGAQGPLYEIRPPVSAPRWNGRDYDAIDWRDGGVITAYTHGEEQAGYAAPVLPTSLAARHAAIWANDFHLQVELPLVLWRPAMRPTRTVMPPPIAWQARLLTFRGTFGRKYPGRWVPVPWIYDDEVHICQQAEDPQNCNIVLEALTGTALSGQCRSVPRWATRNMLAGIAGVPPDTITLLGSPASSELPTLRDGDVIHYIQAPAASSAHLSSLRSLWTWWLGLATVTPVLNFRAPPIVFACAILMHPVFAGQSHLPHHAYTTWPAAVEIRSSAPLAPLGRCRLAPASQRAEFEEAASDHTPYEAIRTQVHDTKPLPKEASEARGITRAPAAWRVAVLVGLVNRGNWPTRRITGWSLLLLACYLAARGAPPISSRSGTHTWELDMRSTAALTSKLHEFWWTHPLRTGLPMLSPPALVTTWHTFPQWQGGVPHSIVVATDGSGRHQGSWAFAAWAYSGRSWSRIGWAAAPMSQTPWIPAAVREHNSNLASFYGELAALQAAALWLAAALDHWQLYTGSRPNEVTLAVDNASALQVAAGYGQTPGALASLTRQAWQSVQTRISTRFQHVHSHTGLVANTIADYLAEVSAERKEPGFVDAAALEVSQAEFDEVFPWLWLIPACTIRNGHPVYVFRTAERDARQAVEDESPTPATDEHQGQRQSVQVDLHLLTANVQTMKDAPCSIFNPSGLAARRQFLYRQMLACQADVVCIQEARSRAGRWKGPGVLTWRSGAVKGQYGCEIWIREDVVRPALSLQDWRIVASAARILCITCVAPRLPLTVVSAHAPHADRPDSEAHAFWNDLREVIRKCPSRSAIVIGIDANGDVHAADDDQALIGDLLAQTEPRRNDDCLLEFCLVAGFELPSTFSQIQLGAGWSWQHTSGKTKRLDHLLFRPGPWTHHNTSQAFDFDIVNAVRDHVALRAKSTLTGRISSHRSPQDKRVARQAAEQIGSSFWESLAYNPSIPKHADDMIDEVHSAYQRAARALPRSPVPRVKQPYLHEQTVVALFLLRDWRAQLRSLTKTLRQSWLSAVWDAWNQRLRDRRRSLFMQKLMIGAYRLHELRLQNRVHGLARKDKALYFLRLTKHAVDEWHNTGQPMQAIMHLKWASKRSADRRAVYAAGGYDIEAELEEQFRAQEGGLHVTENQLQVRIRRWASEASAGCPAAMPTLTDIEQVCLRQKGGKAPGPDSLPNELWKLNPPKAGRWLWQLCTHIALSGREPAHFKRALQCALYKRGPASLPSNYRSIALLNGVAKIWHSHIRGTLGSSVIHGYDPLQLGGRKRIPVAFAVTTFRNVWELGIAQGFCCAALFVDIQAAYYETSRTLLFHGDASLEVPVEPRSRHLAILSHQLASNGALHEIGVQQDELDLLLDCVACSHWQMVGSSNVYLATRGSRPGDGLADVLFGALFSVALRHIRHQCRREGIAHAGAGQLIGNSGDVIPVGWADDLAVLADFESPAALQAQLPRMADIVISTLEHLRFRVNLGPGKTEAMVDIRGPHAKQVRADLLTGSSALTLPDGRGIRISPEYRYLGVIQQPRDNGRRDQELCRQRAQAAWAQARSLFASTSVPWELKQSWLAARILPAAYATLATNTALSRRATAPLEGFYERATRILAQSWQYGHVLTKPSLYLLAGLPSPAHAAVVAKVRLVTQLCKQAPTAVWDLHEACWNRSTPWSEQLVDACRRVLPALPQLNTEKHVTLLLLQRHGQAFVKACKHLSRFGSAYAAFWELWSDIMQRRPTKVLGAPGNFCCPLCQRLFPSHQAVAAHIHRQHSVLNCLTLHTAGTICLWCHTDHFSSDRLKYHLKTNPACVHGLRVVVGEAYQYGSGSKRTGARGHRGLPPMRLPGPRNATSAQRIAAAEQRLPTDAELRQELQAATGTDDVYSWPRHVQVGPDIADSVALVPDGADEPLRQNLYTQAPPDGANVWRRIADAADPDVSGMPSPFWAGLLMQGALWGLPASWHRYWPLWSAADNIADPWSHLARRAQSLIRASVHGPHAGLPSRKSLIANTIAFRQICHCVSLGGLFWMQGLPSAQGTELIRKLLPHASLFHLRTSTGGIFVASHPSCNPGIWRHKLVLSFSADKAVEAGLGSLLQPSVIYHSRSLVSSSGS